VLVVWPPETAPAGSVDLEILLVVNKRRIERPMMYADIKWSTSPDSRHMITIGCHLARFWLVSFNCFGIQSIE
jgi:hypothetical protein